MPFDDTGKIIGLPDDRVVDRLARLGITPIPEADVERYKVAYTAVWLQKGFGVGRQGPFVWRTVPFDHWKSHEASRTSARTNHEKVMRSITLKDFLAAPMKFKMRSSDKTGAPEGLIALANTVERCVAGAKFSVDYFDTDPVLYVHYDDQRACLGIWDDGRTVAIADHTLVADVPPTGFLGNLRRTLFMGGLWGR